jgi:hypothetical protein
LSSLPLEACGLALEACGLPAPGHLLLGQALSEPRIHSQNNLNLVPIDYFFSTLTPGLKGEVMHRLQASLMTCSFGGSRH